MTKPKRRRRKIITWVAVAYIGAWLFCLTTYIVSSQPQWQRSGTGTTMMFKLNLDGTVYETDERARANPLVVLLVSIKVDQYLDSPGFQSTRVNLITFPEGPLIQIDEDSVADAFMKSELPPLLASNPAATNDVDQIIRVGGGTIRHFVPSSIFAAFGYDFGRLGTIWGAIVAVVAGYLWYVFWRDARRRCRPGHCPECGYEYGFETSLCPECGAGRAGAPARRVKP